MNIRTRLFILVLLPFLTALIAATASLWLVYSVADSFYEKRFVDDLVRDAFELVLVNREVLGHPDDDATRARMQRVLARLDKLTAQLGGEDHGSQVLRAAITAELATLRDATSKMAALSGELSVDWYSLIELVQQQRQLILANSSSLIDHALRLGANNTQSILDTHRQVNGIFIASMGVFSLCMAGSGWWFGRRMVDTLRRLEQGAQQLGAGDLDYRLKVSGQDELAQLAFAFNRMAERLRDTLASREQLNREIAERRQAEQALEHSERRFRGFFDNGNIGMAIVAANGAWARVNPKLCQMLGYSAADLETWRWVEHTHPEDRAAAQTRFLHLLSGEIDEYEMDQRFLGAEGRVLYTHVTVACFRDTEGRVGDVLFTLLDIGARVAAERRVAERTLALSQALAELQSTQQTLLQNERLATVGAMAAGVAHELNNPLMGVINYVQFAQKRAEDERAIEMLGKAERELRRMGKVVQELLHFSRPGSATVGAVDVADVVRYALDLLGADLVKHGISVSLELPPDLPKVHADADGLQQVLMNLLINARDALADRPLKRILIRATLDKAELRLTVWDSGPGVPPERRERIFAPFFTTKPAGKGTGLGLTVSASILRSFGASLQYLESARGGAEFALCLMVTNSSG